MNTPLLQQAFKYKAWSDRRTLDAIAQIDIHAQRDAFAFVRQQLNHLIRVEELFKARLLAEAAPHASTNTESLPELAELDSRLMQSNAWFQQYINETPTTLWQQTLSFEFVDGKRGCMTREEIFFHIINHGTYHRGAIGHALDLAKAPRPADTYTVFIHAAEPDRRL